ncbi:hypothetical protein JMJ77_0013636 [Colletotrichum scovillei]|uniref:Uncharacterized protein n=1 Tax=Colletotrichum scovillei TaxID=1209932 RepID=A0A9P7QPZ8_9PEZI|nr:hypothetical protein JMJ78_0012925 [Colletotrichum scovillei]KAG7040639.1 hypothetical protein JMJ77_0013636 [Colletotrichum scovillei]KAG7060686.1 hypothetical protein JMJ76_0006229 [Colletotrichum scovillei]
MATVERLPSTEQPSTADPARKFFEPFVKKFVEMIFSQCDVVNSSTEVKIASILGGLKDSSIRSIGSFWLIMGNHPEAKRLIQPFDRVMFFYNNGREDITKDTENAILDLWRSVFREVEPLKDFDPVTNLAEDSIELMEGLLKDHSVASLITELTGLGVSD